MNPNRITKIGYGHIFLREGNLSFNNNYIINELKCTRLITGLITKVTQRVPHVEQELLTLPKYTCGTRWVTFVINPVISRVHFNIEYI
jgi:hypothetical protein